MSHVASNIRVAGGKLEHLWSKVSEQHANCTPCSVRSQYKKRSVASTVQCEAWKAPSPLLKWRGCRSYPKGPPESTTSLFTNDILCLFVSSQSKEHRLTKLIVVSPLGELDLRNQQGCSDWEPGPSTTRTVPRLDNRRSFYHLLASFPISSNNQVSINLCLHEREFERIQ